jgi:transposase
LAVCGARVSEATICRAIKGRLSRNRKKDRLKQPREMRGSGQFGASWSASWIARARCWSTRWAPIPRLPLCTATHPVGKRGFFKVPRNRGTNTRLLASMGSEGMEPSMAVEGSTTKEVFEAYIEHFLAPTLKGGQVVVMDNLSAHKGQRVRKLIEERDCELVYLPPYSPDLNPIEEAFSKMKGILRKVGARSREALIEAMGKALDAITSWDAKGFFEHCGYRSPGQLL